MKRKRIDIITLGCSKNLVDSEQLMRQLEEVGYSVTHDTENPQGEIAVINTCGFIGDAKEESINMILEFAERKEEGDLKKLFVMGCLSERYLKELAVEIPQVDKFYGKFNWKELLQDLGKVYHDELYIERTLTTPQHYAYLKISEGCDRKCSYCAIPIITGRHISKPMEEILDEVRYLVSQGVKEFQVIAQELTYYGIDRYKKQMLPVQTEDGQSLYLFILYIGNTFRINQIITAFCLASFLEVCFELGCTPVREYLVKSDTDRIHIGIEDGVPACLIFPSAFFVLLTGHKVHIDSVLG